MTPVTHRSPVAAMTIGASATIVCLLPVFLTGAMAVQITGELGFGAVGLGVAVALHRAGAAATSPFLGRLADGLGATRSIRIATTAAAIASLGIALTASSWPTLAVWLVLSGASHGFVSPAANRMLSNAVPAGRLGAAFGIKQSAPPATTMLAGLSVPLIALTVGWRAAFFTAAGLALLVTLSTRHTVPRAERSKGARSRPAPLTDRGVLLVLGVAAGFASAASSATTTFYVDSAVLAGTSPQLAGVLLAVASTAAVATRTGAGFLSDRMPSGHLTMCAALVASGAIGLGMMASGTPTQMSFGITLTLVGVWGFNGVFWYALVRAYPDAPGRITGTIAPGVLLGATVGPTVSGVLVAAFGYPTMWSITAVAAVLAAGGIHLGGRRLPAPSATLST